jgi:predicted Zn finger-like uncharacterized protein
VIVQCHSCFRRYQLDDALLGLRGSHVRCTNCQHIWFQAPAPQTRALILRPVLTTPLLGKKRAFWKNLSLGSRIFAWVGLSALAVSIVIAIGILAVQTPQRLGANNPSSVSLTTGHWRHLPLVSHLSDHLSNWMNAVTSWWAPHHGKNKACWTIAQAEVSGAGLVVRSFDFQITGLADGKPGLLVQGVLANQAKKRLVKPQITFLITAQTRDDRAAQLDVPKGQAQSLVSQPAPDQRLASQPQPAQPLPNQNPPDQPQPAQSSPDQRFPAQPKAQEDKPVIKTMALERILDLTIEPGTEQNFEVYLPLPAGSLLAVVPVAGP